MFELKFVFFMDNNFIGEIFFFGLYFEAQFAANTSQPRVTGEEEELWSGYSENEEEVGPSNKECDGKDTNENGKEATENCEDRVEEPKVEMTFDSLDKAYFYYCQFAKEKGFVMCKRISRKGKDEKLSYVTLSCSRGGKAKVTTSNLVKPGPHAWF
ncbi:hypothetical protein RHGRI_000085 [Rhododendron griersonianum]|uniref:FAR1 domain-containing protein n=1 Tax=Rhododendron griersonianum TaxID=479676 RepID=A0AAV6LGC1_9ERIC|nr:hypothetical protein RHGRI_000085 [Rhododendron griersonianum]